MAEFTPLEESSGAVLTPTPPPAPETATPATTVAFVPAAASSSDQQQPANPAAAAAGLATLLSVFGSSVRAQAQQRRKLHPWAKLVGDRASYSVPSPRYVAARVRSNLAFFQLNYNAILAALVFVMALFNFKFFLAVVALAALWGYFLWWRTEPVVVAGHELGTRIITAGLGAVTVVALWLMLGKAVFWVFGVGVAVMLVHAAFYTSAEEAIDFTRPV